MFLGLLKWQGSVETDHRIAAAVASLAAAAAVAENMLLNLAASTAVFKMTAASAAVILPISYCCCYCCCSFKVLLLKLGIIAVKNVGHKRTENFKPRLHLWLLKNSCFSGFKFGNTNIGHSGT